MRGLSPLSGLHPPQLPITPHCCLSVMMLRTIQNIITRSSIRLVGVLLLFMATCQAFVLPENSSGALGSRYNLNPSHRTIRSQLRAGLFGSQETNSKDAAVPKRIIEIPVKSIKKGGLRMVLGLSLIGLQNTPDKG